MVTRVTDINIECGFGRTTNPNTVLCSSPVTVYTMAPSATKISMDSMTVWFSDPLIPQV